MEKKYSFIGVCISLFKALLLFAVWFLVQFAAVFIFAFIGADFDKYALEANIVCNCLCILILAFVCKARNKALSEEASINKMPPHFAVSTGLMGVAFYYVISVILGILVMTSILPDSWVAAQENQYAYMENSSYAIEFLSTVIMAPLMEEILFRGMILGTLKKEMHPWIAIILSSVIFGVAHGTIIGIMYATGLGIMMGWLCVKFNSIIPSLVFHMAYNCAVLNIEEISLVALVLSVPILIYEIIDINKYFRGRDL